MSVAKLEKLIVSNFGLLRKLGNFYSIYDLIRVCGHKNPRDAWKRLCDKYPEVVAYSDNLKFPGSGQRETPVTDKSGLLYILGLLPGNIGKEYRQEVTNTIYQLLEVPEELAYDITSNAKSNKQLNQIVDKVLEAREHYLDSYHSFNSVIANAGGKNAVIVVNGLNTTGIRGKTPAEIRLETGKASGRADLSYDETIKLACVQLYQILKLQKTQAISFEAIQDCKQVLDKFLELENV